MTTIAQRVATRYASRPIHLDKQGIAAFVSNQLIPEVERWLRRRPQDQPVGANNGFARDWYTVEAADGRSTLRVEVALRFVHSNAKGAVVMGGGFGHRGKDPIIIVDLNGAFTAGELLSEKMMQPVHACTYHTCLPWSIYNVLIHELTHASESIFPTPPSAKGQNNVIPTEGDANYVNNPAEVRAFMQEIVDQVLRSAKIEAIRRRAQGKHNPNKELIDLALMLSTTWSLVQKTLRPENKAKILRAVYDALDRNNLLIA